MLFRSGVQIVSAKDVSLGSSDNGVEGLSVQARGNIYLSSNNDFGLCSGVDLITLFIGLETMAVSFYALAGFLKPSQRSNEASVKYYLLGAFSTGILLYGMSLLYGLTGGEVSFAGLAEKSVGLTGEPAFVMAVLFVIVGFGFKVSAVPFHFWAPDTYEGAPTPITAYLSVNSKAAGFVALLIVMYSALPAASDVWAPAQIGRAHV